MKILLVIDQFNGENNGTTISAIHLAEYLTSVGDDVKILTTGKGGKNIYAVPERYIPLATYFAHKQGMLFGKPIKSVLTQAIAECDVVHFFMPWKLAKQGVKVAKKLHKPYTAAFHVQPENITYNIGLRNVNFANALLYHGLRMSFYKNIQHIHCPSNFIAGELRRNHYKGKLHIISNGVNKKFVPANTPKPANLEDKFIITMAGRLSVEKNQNVLIKAVNESKYRDKIQLIFAGSGPKEEQYKQLGKKLPNMPIFKFYDQSGLINVLQYTDLYVHSADVEIEAISCIEAMACGLVPVISDSPTSATKQFALDDRSLFRTGDSHDLAAKIDYWIEHPEENQEMSVKYREYSKQFAQEQCMAQMREMFVEAIDEYETINHK